MKRLIEKIDPVRLDERHEGRFSPREVIAHLADWEPILLSRMHTAVNTPGGRIEPYDEGEMAIAHKYSESDVQEQLRKFASSRAETAAYLRALPQSEWSKAGRHPERGEMSVIDQAGMLIGHDMYHIEQLSTYL
jgi:hypothetical protein